MRIYLISKLFLVRLFAAFVDLLIDERFAWILLAIGVPVVKLLLFPCLLTRVLWFYKLRLLATPAM